jgi:amidase
VADDFAYASAIDTAAAIAARSVSSRELVLSAVERIERIDGEINAVVRLDVEAALKAADAADELTAAGSSSGPLHGVPITLKDSLQTKGLITTSGAPELATHVPEIDAAPVKAYRDAGAVIIGKTNLPIWAGDVQSYNDVYGTTSNPYDLTRSPGGSSGGSAASLAAGFSPIEIGSDIAGSIRNPAAMCGVVGHKPSYGLCSARGQIPGMPGSLTQADIAVVGPMARTVADAHLGLDLLAGPDDWHDHAWSVDLPPARKVGSHGLRVAAWLDDPECTIGSEIVTLLEAVGSSLSEAGAIVDLDARPSFTFAKARATFDQLIGGALAGSWSTTEIEQLASRSDPPGGLGVHHAAQRHRAWLSANERRLQMRRRWKSFFEDWDVCLMPVSPRAAVLHDHSEPMTSRRIDVDGADRAYTDQMAWMGVIGVVYLPSTVVPIGFTSDGLPVGIQIVGPFLEDNTCLAVAKIVEELAGGFVKPTL